MIFFAKGFIRIIMIFLITILVVWEIYWTVRACWLAAKNNDKGWFIFFLIFQLLGIPEMIYIYNKKQKKIEDNSNKS